MTAGQGDALFWQNTDRQQGRGQEGGNAQNGCFERKPPAALLKSIWIDEGAISPASTAAQPRAKERVLTVPDGRGGFKYA